MVFPTVQKSKNALLVALCALLTITLIGTVWALRQVDQFEKPQPFFYRVAFTGDSLTAGFFATSEEADYKSVFLRLLQQKDPQSHVETSVATAIGGVDVPGVLAYLRAHPEKIPRDEDLFVVELGTNDYGKGHDLHLFEAQYQELLALIGARSPRVTFACLSVWGRPEGEPISPTVRASDYSAIIARSCQASGHRFVNVDITRYYMDFSLHGPEGKTTFRGTADWFHPNDAGHQKIAQTLMADIAPLLPKPSVDGTLIASAKESRRLKSR